VLCDGVGAFAFTVNPLAIIECNYFSIIQYYLV